MNQKITNNSWRARCLVGVLLVDVGMVELQAYDDTSHFSYRSTARERRTGSAA